MKDFPGTLSEYASALIDHENESITSTENIIAEIGNAAGPGNNMKDVYKDDKAKRNEYRNNIRQVKRDLENAEKAFEKLKLQSAKKQKEIDDSSTAGWSVLAGLTDELNKINELIEQKEFQWMELAEQLEAAEIDV